MDRFDELNQKYPGAKRQFRWRLVNVLFNLALAGVFIYAGAYLYALVMIGWGWLASTIMAYADSIRVIKLSAANIESSRAYQREIESIFAKYPDDIEIRELKIKHLANDYVFKALHHAHARFDD